MIDCLQLFSSFQIIKTNQLLRAIVSSFLKKRYNFTSYPINDKNNPTMTSTLFNTLHEHEQFKMVWQHAVLVAERIDHKYFYRLYQMGSFYVEEQWHKTFKNRVAFKPFNCMDDAIDPYLEQIEIAL